MSKRQLFNRVLAGSITLLFAGSASALSEWGTRVSTSTADCPSFCTNFTFGTSTGGQNELTATGSVDTFQGNAQALAQLAAGPGINVPNLQAEAYSESAGQGSAFGFAYGAEGYTYTGPGSQTFTIDITLTGSVFDPSPLDRDTSITAEIYIFEPDNFFYGYGIPTLVFEAGAVVIDSVELDITGNETNGVRNGSVSFTLATGESVYLYSTLDVDAEREMSFADAFGTLSLDFQDSTGLVAASIPEPGTFGLLALGLLGLARKRR